MGVLSVLVVGLLAPVAPFRTLSAPARRTSVVTWLRPTVYSKQAGGLLKLLDENAREAAHETQRK